MKKPLIVLGAATLAAACGLSMAGCGGQELHVANSKELADAITKGGEVVLDQDITLDKTLVVSGNVKLNLNGKTLTENLEWNETQGADQKITVIKVAKGGDLTVVGNGKIKSNDLYLFDVVGDTQNSAKLTIESGVFESDLTAVQVETGLAEIKGGTYRVTPKNVTHGTKYLLNVINENRDKAKITVTGGTFEGFDVSKDVNGDGAYLADGYKVTKGENDTYVVTAK